MPSGRQRQEFCCTTAGIQAPPDSDDLQLHNDCGAPHVLALYALVLSQIRSLTCQLSSACCCKNGVSNHPNPPPPSPQNVENAGHLKHQQYIHTQTAPVMPDTARAGLAGLLWAHRVGQAGVPHRLHQHRHQGAALRQLPLLQDPAGPGEPSLQAPRHPLPCLAEGNDALTCCRMVMI